MRNSIRTRRDGLRDSIKAKSEGLRDSMRERLRNTINNNIPHSPSLTRLREKFQTSTLNEGPSGIEMGTNTEPITHNINLYKKVHNRKYPVISSYT